MSRVALAQIGSLTFFKGESTKGRRLSPVQQLSCLGNACRLYQPEVVRCYNTGGKGTEIDWTCEADLPEKLRFGRVEVSCEGWDHSGDPYVLKDSCGLEYRLVKVPDQFGTSKSFSSKAMSILLGAISISILLYILYTIFKPCLGSLTFNTRRPPRPPYPSGHRPGGFTSGRGSFDQSPPPYSEAPKPSTSTRNGESSGFLGGFQPGFWSGMGLGGLGATMAARAFRGNEDRTQQAPRLAREYDWERVQSERSSSFGSFPFSPAPSASVSQRRRDDNRGEGSSNLGSMRRSTGYGVSNVR